MRVTYFHRCPIDISFSIERVFSDVRKYIDPGIDCRVAVSRFISQGVARRIYNVIEASFRQGDLNHVTGDVHFLTYLLRKKRTILTIHDCVILNRTKGLEQKIYYFFWFWLPVKRSSCVSVISEATKRELLSYLRCDPEKIRVVYDPVSDDFKTVLKEFNPQKPVILQVGTIEEKNIYRLSEALEGISCHLRIVGKLPISTAEVLKRKGIEYTSVAGITGEEMVEEYRRCDMLAFVSTYEGFGLPIVEANATGRPVITSNILSMPEVAGDAACIVDPFDVDSIRQGVLRVIRDKNYRQQLIERGLRNVERFRPAVIAENYTKLYQMVLERGAGKLEK